MTAASELADESQPAEPSGPGAGLEARPARRFGFGFGRARARGRGQTRGGEVRSARRSASTPRRVRTAVYLAFALVATLVALEGWHSLQVMERAQREGQLLQRVTEARAQAYELAAQAAALHALAPAERERAVAQLSRRAGEGAAALSALEQALGNEAADQGVRRRLADWRAAHERLRVRLAGLAGPAAPAAAADAAGAGAAGPGAPLGPGERGVLDEARGAAGSALALAQVLADRQERLQQRTEVVVWAQVGILALTLVLLALLVVEPMVRSVERRVEAARTLAGPLRRLARVPENTASLVLITDRHDRIRWCNAGFVQMVGWRYEDVRHALPGEMLRHPEADIEALKAIRAAVAHGQPLRQESLHRRKDGSDLWLDLEVRPLRDSAGKLRGFVYLGVDITDRVVEQARLRLQWLGLPMGVLVHAPDGAVTDSNREAERLLGCARDELVGRRLADTGWRFVRGDLTLCQPADLPAERTLRERMPLIGEVIGLRQEDGGLRWLLVNSHLQIGLGGAVTDVLVSLADITGRFEATRARPVAVA